MGHEGFLQLANSLKPANAKYGDKTMGTFEFLLNLLNQLGPEVLGQLERGERKLTTEEIIRLIFDHTGRSIPAHIGVVSKVCDENRSFHVELPELSWGEILERLVSRFPRGTEFASASEFQERALTLREKYLGNELVANFFKRAKPIPFPKHDARKNMGASMQNFVLPAVELAKEHFPKQKFTNYRDGQLDGNVFIIPNTGHNELVELMAKESVVAWYSPNSFQGFSINAQREAMKVLLQYGFALAGGVDTGTAAVAYAKEMARDYQTPVYTCSALAWRSAGYSLGFGASDGELCFDRTDRLADAHEHRSGGLVLFR